MHQLYKNFGHIGLEILTNDPFMSYDLFDLDQIKDELTHVLKFVDERITAIKFELDPER